MPLTRHTDSVLIFAQTACLTPPKRARKTVRLPFARAYDGADLTDHLECAANGHPIFYLTGSKQDLDPIANPADYEADSTEDEEGDEVGFEEFCYRMRRSAESAETGKGAGAYALGPRCIRPILRAERCTRCRDDVNVEQVNQRITSLSASISRRRSSSSV